MSGWILFGNERGSSRLKFGLGTRGEVLCCGDDASNALFPSLFPLARNKNPWVSVTLGHCMRVEVFYPTLDPIEADV